MAHTQHLAVEVFSNAWVAHLLARGSLQQLFKHRKGDWSGWTDARGRQTSVLRLPPDQRCTERWEGKGAAEERGVRAWPSGSLAGVPRSTESAHCHLCACGGFRGGDAPAAGLRGRGVGEQRRWGRASRLRAVCRGVPLAGSVDTGLQWRAGLLKGLRRW